MSAESGTPSDDVHSTTQAAEVRGTAVITGATSGIGLAFARHFAAQGHPLLLTGRREKELGEAGDELARQHGVEVARFVGDLAEHTVRERLVERVHAAAPVDVLVNNAGFGLPGSFLENGAGDHLGMLALHNQLAVSLTHVVAGEMADRGGGTIINVSSLASQLPAPGASTYAATKGFLNLFSEVLALELGPKGVTVQALLPGFTETEFHRYFDDVAALKRSTWPLPWMSAEAVVRYSVKKLGSGKVLCIPGFGNRLATTLGRITPRRLIYRIARRAKL